MPGATRDGLCSAPGWQKQCGQNNTQVMPQISYFETGAEEPWTKPTGAAEYIPQISSISFGPGKHSIPWGKKYTPQNSWLWVRPLFWGSFLLGMRGGCGSWGSFLVIGVGLAGNSGEGCRVISGEFWGSGDSGGGKGKSGAKKRRCK